MNRTVAGLLAEWAYEDWLEQMQQDAEEEADHYFEGKT